jgi:hypothetical protein
MESPPSGAWHHANGVYENPAPDRAANAAHAKRGEI